jgi:opacity protein-like surface antigen
MSSLRGLLGAGGLVLLGAAAAQADDPGPTARRIRTITSVEAGGGIQEDIDHHSTPTGLEFWHAAVRVGLLAADSGGAGALGGAFEVGLAAIFQRYTHPVDASFQGLGVAFRYHVLQLGPVVPYLEAIGAAGASDLRVREIRSDFAFWLAAGLGVSVFIAPRTAVYAGYRLLHISNGNTDDPNRGLEAHTGLLGVSFLHD